MDVRAAGTECLLVAVVRGTLAQPQNVHEANIDSAAAFTEAWHRMNLYRSETHKS